MKPKCPECGTSQTYARELENQRDRAINQAMETALKYSKVVDEFNELSDKYLDVVNKYIALKGGDDEN